MASRSTMGIGAFALLLLLQVASAVPGRAVCESCQRAVSGLQKRIQQHPLAKRLPETLCKQATFTADECDVFFDTKLPAALTWVEKPEHATTVCMRIQACESQGTLQQKEPSLAPTSNENINAIVRALAAMARLDGYGWQADTSRPHIKREGA